MTPINNATIGIELINDKNWMGGTLYLKNLVMILSQLPASERPKIKLFGSQTMIKELEKEMGRCQDANFRFWIDKLFNLVRKNRFCYQDQTIDVAYPGFGSVQGSHKLLRWIPDFQHKHYPDLFTNEELQKRDLAIKDIVESGESVVLSSKTALHDLETFFPNSSAKINVWRFCSLIDWSACQSQMLQKYRIPEKFLYLPNQFWAHKNHLTVLKALSSLKKKGVVIPLVCTGTQNDRRNKMHFSRILKFIEKEQLAAQVYLLGLIPRNDQIEIFRKAAAVIQPSCFEGWSTVVEDTRAIGRPIFLSDIPVHREQAPPKAIYFSPLSGSILADLLYYNWPLYRSGPDFLSEQHARNEMNQIIRSTALEFCKIIQNTIQSKTKH